MLRIASSRLAPRPALPGRNVNHAFDLAFAIGVIGMRGWLYGFGSCSSAISHHTACKRREGLGHRRYL
jgi:hypothetical protein